MMTQGTLVDATIIEAPSSTKNKEQQRDPEMHQTKKGNQWHFGMKAHIGVDAKSGLTHSLVTTAANEHDLNQLGNLLHGEEQFVSADAGYQGAPQREELAEVDVDWLIAERPGRVKTLKQHPRKNKTAINIEYMKASIRATAWSPPRPTSMTSISWVICCMERSNLSQPMPATKGRHSARSWPRWMWTG